MSQLRYFSYKADDLTISLDQWLLGILRAGYYGGFDFVPSADMTLVLDQETTGYEITDIDQNVAKWGVLLTKQGVVIKENAAINLAVNPTTLEPRIDLVICTHTYVATTGGIQAVYSILQGTAAENPIAPTVPDEATTTVVGGLYLPLGTSQLDGVGVTFTKSAIPSLGGNDLSIQSPIGTLSVIENALANGKRSFDFDVQTVQVASGAWKDVTTSGAYIGDLSDDPVEGGGNVLITSQYISIDSNDRWAVTYLFQSLADNSLWARTVIWEYDLATGIIGTEVSDSTFSRVERPLSDLLSTIDDRVVETVDPRLNGLISSEINNIQNVPLDLLGTFEVSVLVDDPAPGTSTYSWPDGTLYWNGNIYEVDADSGVQAANGSDLTFTVQGSGNLRTLNLVVQDPASGDFNSAEIKTWNTEGWITPTLNSGFGTGLVEFQFKYRIRCGVVYFIGLPIKTNGDTAYNVMYQLPIKHRPNVAFYGQLINYASQAFQQANDVTIRSDGNISIAGEDGNLTFNSISFPLY